MSSPPKKMRKNAAGGGGGDGAANTSANDSAVGAAPANAEPVANDNNDVEMDDDLDPAAMYEDEEGMSQSNISTNSIRFELNFIYLDPKQVVIVSAISTFRHRSNRIVPVNRRARA